MSFRQSEKIADKVGQEERQTKGEFLMRKAVASLVFFIFVVFLSGCHTVHGVGQDIESAGKSIEKATGK